MTPEMFVTAFVTLFLVIDPIGLVPFYIALTADNTGRERRAIALRAALIAAVVLAIFGLAGDVILKGIGIGMPAFRIAGGLLLFLTAVVMLFERRAARREGQADDAERPDPSVFPRLLHLHLACRLQLHRRFQGNALRLPHRELRDARGGDVAN